MIGNYISHRARAVKWITSQQLSTWANSVDARSILSRLIGQLIWASAPDISAFRFPAGDSAQVPGLDGQLTAKPHGHYKAYVPEGDSVWEFGTEKTVKKKAESDYLKRTKSPPAGVTPEDTTFVFVTPRTWQDAHKWITSKKESCIWKDVRVIDAVDLEEWMLRCPAAAASFAQENGFAPAKGALSVDDFWDTYSHRFEPPLTEAVLLAGRSIQQQELQNALTSGRGIQRCKGDSLDEVIAFLCATIRSAEITAQQYMRARTLIVETEDAARQLRNNPNLVFAVRGVDKDIPGLLSVGHRVIVPVGRDDARSAPAIALVRPMAHEMSEALQAMEISPEKALQLARQCGRSVTVLERLIPGGVASACQWRDDVALLPAFLAGAWDRSLESDRAVITSLASTARYEDAEAAFRRYLTHTDGPLELVDSVWAVRAPVDMFVQLRHLLLEDHFKALRIAVTTVLGEHDPALDLPHHERMYAGVRKQALIYSGWLRYGLSTTLLILAALGEQNEVQVGIKSSQAFVNELVADLPGLNEDHRVIASLSHQLSILMEASPGPLLTALERLLETDGQTPESLFQDRKGISSLWTSSPHTGVLWALELIGRDPEYLQRVAWILMQLEAVDPGGTLSNRPIGTLCHLFSVLLPSTNAPHEMRIAVLMQLTSKDSIVAWNLILGLIPSGGIFQLETRGPLFREAGASDRETLTYGILYKMLTRLADRASELAGLDPRRWADLIEKINQLPAGDQGSLISKFESAVLRMTEEDRLVIWKPLSRLIRRHEAHMSSDWALAGDQITALQMIEDSIAPKDSAIRDQHLFTERLPDIRGIDHSRSWEQIEAIRNDVVRKLLSEGGPENVVRFACLVEAPRYVGLALGSIEESAYSLLTAIKLSASLERTPPGFVAAVSGMGLARFVADWSLLVKDALSSGQIALALIPELVDLWPHSPETWTWVEQFGAEAEDNYWQSKPAWGLKAEGRQIVHAVDRYLDVSRPEYIVDAFGLKAHELSEEQWYSVLNDYEKRVALQPELLRGHSAEYHIQQIFKYLQKQPTVSIERLAFLEYRFLPFLRKLLNDADPDSALDQYIAKKPELFMEIVATVFRPSSDRGKPKPELSPQEAARGERAFQLLQTFACVPGRTGDSINSQVLGRWVNEVRRLAIEQDRLAVAEQYIGKMLLHAPVDPEDGIWPHRAVREGVESWQSEQIEIGIRIAKANARGVTSRGPLDGGSQERDLAAALRSEAKQLSRWPRTRSIFIALAEGYEREARREDVEASQLRLRE